METEKVQKGTGKFTCISCNYNTSRYSQYERHLLTSKHINSTDFNKLEQMETKRSGDYTCRKCSKKYKERSGLWKHKKTCINSENIVIKLAPTACVPVHVAVPVDAAAPINTDLIAIMHDNDELKKLILEVIKTNMDIQKQNQDLQQQVSNVCKNIQPININNNSHNNNKTFNLQFFLNEQCKDAMNIMDFVDTFQLQLSDLERIGEVGYVEGISSIVMDKLNQMDIYKRPIHCSDAKREIMHVKDKDVWEKENANNDKIRLALKHITKKNTDLLRPWVNAHPGVLDSEHRLNDKYQQLFIEAMGGNSGTLTECETKIIKKLSKMVLIDKTNGSKNCK